MTKKLLLKNKNTSRRSPSPITLRLLVIAILSVIVPNFLTPKPHALFVDAYRIGDTIDVAVSTRSSAAIDMLIANQPLFGVTKTVRLPRLPDRFSLSFEEGLYTIPYIDASTTEKLVVTFVYSKSGAGRIHSVTSKAIQSNRKFDPSRDIEVLFDWVEEAAVDLAAGSIVMFLAVFLVSILFLLQLCTIEQPDDYDDDRHDGHEDSYYKGR